MSASPEIDAAPGGHASEQTESVTIKKYANRRLYNTATSSYITLDHLSEMVKEGTDFVVYDAKSGEDITHAVLTQIIVEEETKGGNLLPIQFLRQLIKFYGDNLQSFLPSYLEMSMDAFARNQEKMREQMRGAFGAAPGYAMFEETARQNMALFEQAMKMFSPVGAFYQQGIPQHPGGGRPGDDGGAREINALKEELKELRAELGKLRAAR